VLKKKSAEDYYIHFQLQLVSDGRFRIYANVLEVTGDIYCWLVIIDKNYLNIELVLKNTSVVVVNSNNIYLMHNI
jgi:hypothetical protein